MVVVKILTKPSQVNHLWRCRCSSGWPAGWRWRLSRGWPRSWWRCRGSWRGRPGTSRSDDLRISSPCTPAKSLPEMVVVNYQPLSKRKKTIKVQLWHNSTLLAMNTGMKTKPRSWSRMSAWRKIKSMNWWRKKQFIELLNNQKTKLTLTS